MALSNRERLTNALDAFTEAYRNWTAQQLTAKYGDEGVGKAQEFLIQGAKPGQHVPSGPEEWDAQALFNILFSMWGTFFRYKLSSTEKSMLHELQTVRNKWAHQEKFGTNDVLRNLDTISRLLNAISASEAANQVESMHGEVMRTRFTEMERTASKRAQRKATEGTPQSGLRPWRDIMVPHPDVRNGNFTQAQFAADLAQVHRGGASSEYGDAKEFFSRTFLTEGLQRLISNALIRLNGKGGHPIIELQTNFGGGKTHSMLTLYHLFSGVALSEMSGMDQLLKEENLEPPPKDARRAVLVGTAFGPGEVQKTEDGLTLKTLWGRLAYQLGGKEAYEMLKSSDQRGTAPGSDTLVKIFNHVGSCLILIDEWVAFCRQTYEKSGLPGGSFDQNLSFAQSLTEAVKAAPKALLVASLPQSQLEVGGTGGQEALASLEDTFGRLESNWRPANQEESYEIVRRRLFEPITDPQLHADRDAVVSAFFGVYSKNKTEFPADTTEGIYEKRMNDAYPIHPELFDRLYNDWSSMQEFQRTRGVLRLMASVIHSLWSRNDRSLMILPGLTPIDERTVEGELTRYLQPNWQVIMSSEVDGPDSLPTRLDGESSRFGQVWATRRVARTVYMGSAPTEGQSNKGLDIRHVRLGCVQPGENVAVFGDALRQLSEHTSHLYSDGARYWYAGQPSILTVARDRATRVQEADRLELIRKELRTTSSNRAEFKAVHAAPQSSGDVPDDTDTKLVILGPEFCHVTGSDSSTAIRTAMEWLEKRGNSPRQHRNTLVFLAADKSRLETLMETVGWVIAWRSITDERESLNLDPFNTKMAESRLEETKTKLSGQLAETYQWLLAPFQDAPTEDEPMKPVLWSAKRLSGGLGLSERAWSKLQRDGLILDKLAGTILRHTLDKTVWKNQPHINISSLSTYFTQYLYMERLAGLEVLSNAIQDGVGNTMWNPETFAYADRYDESTGRYTGLVAGRLIQSVIFDGHSVLVNVEIAAKQIEADKAASPETTTAGEGDTGTTTTGSTPGGTTTVQPEGDTPKETKQKKFYGTVELPPAGAGLKFSEIMQEVVQHFSKDPQNKVKIKVDIEAESPGGFDEATVRTARENANTLNFDQANFE